MSDNNMLPPEVQKEHREMPSRRKRAILYLANCLKRARQEGDVIGEHRILDVIEEGHFAELRVC